MVMGGKTSHLFLGGENGWWYQVSGTWCTYCNSPGTWYVSTTNHGCIFIKRFSDWRVDEVLVIVFTLKMHTKYVVYYFFICTSMIEASKVDHSASCVVGWWWLLAAVFVSAARTLQLGAFEAGGTLSE